MALDKFKKALKDQIKQAKIAKSKVVRVGIVGHQQYEDGTPVAYVATIQEYGTANIPPRPFFRPTIAEKRDEWRKSVVNMISSNLPAIEALELVGIKATEDIKVKIGEITSPRLAIATLKARNRKAHKGGLKPKAISIKPLIDTGLMQKSISSVVVDREE